MLKWISNVIAGATAAVPDGVPKAWAALLNEAIAPVEAIKGARAGLAGDIAGYVLRGEPIAVLHEVGQTQGVAEALGLAGYSGANRSAASFYAEFGQVPEPVALRWAQVLDASLGRHRSYCSYAFPGGIHWPEALLMHAADRTMGGWSSEPPVPRGLSMAKLEALLSAAGVPESALLVSAFASPVNANYGAERHLAMAGRLPDFADALHRHVEAIRPHLLQPLVAQRLHVLKLLGEAEAQTIALVAGELAELATVASKQVRAAAEPLVRKFPEPLIGPLKSIAVDGKPEQRVGALRLLWALARQRSDDALLAFAVTTAKGDKAPNVQALPQEWESGDQAASSDAASDDYRYELPTVVWRTDLSPPVSGALDDLWRELNAAVDKSNKQARESHARSVAAGHKWPLHLAREYSAKDLSLLRDFIASSATNFAGEARKDHHWGLVDTPLQRFAANPAVTPVVAIKTLAAMGLVTRGSGLMIFPTTVFNAMHRVSGRPTLLEVQMLLEPFGIGPAEVLKAYCNTWNSLGTAWPDEAIWPFFAHNIDHLTEQLNPTKTKDYSFDRGGLFRAISTLPKPPERVVNALFDVALGTAKSERLAAQEALANLPNKEVRIVNALSDGKGDTRAVAAQWLGRLRHAPAIDALETAVAKEKQDVAKGAMIDALQVLGQPVEKYLDRKALAAEAKKSLAKGLPKDLEWFPWAAMPGVRWADNGESVGDDVLRWMLVQAVKQKTPEPNAVLRKYCAMFDSRDREAFGQYVLEAWLREDVRPIPPEEALRLAQGHAQSLHGYMQRYPQHYQDDPNFGRSVEELTAACLPRFLRQPAGSAIGSKGLLAVTAACAAERASLPVHRFLKEHYGTRAAQGKALIAMLAWIEHPSATQLMLSIGNRFRTKGFQDEASRQAEALAERKGWTLSELADRTIPSGGFDETGTLELSYGERTFTAHLMPDFKVELHNPSGKKIAALPEPRQDDDAELVKDAKKVFAAAKKEIKSIVDLQTDRLYEALCTERDWSFEDWSAYLNRHPVVRRLVQRLVWAQVETHDGAMRLAQVFRPLDDGSLTDADDNEVQVPANARVRVAHDSLLSAEQVALWQAHLADYEVVPLFQQLGKGVYSLPAAQAQADSIDDFEGHLIETFALRNRALKLGYTRGAAEDGGWFFVYEKRFPTLGIVAAIEFTGNGLPEENRTVALLKLSFSGAQGGRMSLGKVPKVLLSECYNDLRLVAAEGSGFDPEWQKKSEY
jgi:hypothetical protein